MDPSLRASILQLEKKLHDEGRTLETTSLAGPQNRVSADDRSIDPALRASIHRLDKKLYNSDGSPRGPYMWKTGSNDRTAEQSLPFQPGELLDGLYREPLFLNTHQVQTWIESDQVRPHLKQMVSAIHLYDRYRELYDTAALENWETWDTFDTLLGLMASTQGKRLAECDDAYEVAAKTAMLIAKASSAPDYLFDATEFLPKGWSKEYFCQYIAIRLVMVVLVNLRDFLDGYFSELLGYRLPQPSSSIIAVLDNRHPKLRANGRYASIKPRVREARDGEFQLQQGDTRLPSPSEDTVMEDQVDESNDLIAIDHSLPTKGGKRARLDEDQDFIPGHENTPPAGRRLRKSGGFHDTDNKGRLNSSDHELPRNELRSRGKIMTTRSQGGNKRPPRRLRKPSWIIHDSDSE